jgi:hypothetical protein
VGCGLALPVDTSGLSVTGIQTNNKLLDITYYPAAIGLIQVRQGFQIDMYKTEIPPDLMGHKGYVPIQRMIHIYHLPFIAEPFGLELGKEELPEDSDEKFN